MENIEYNSRKLSIEHKFNPWEVFACKREVKRWTQKKKIRAPTNKGYKIEHKNTI